MSPNIFIDGSMRGSCTKVSYVSPLLIVKPILIKDSSRRGVTSDSFINPLPHWTVPWCPFCFDCCLSRLASIYYIYPALEDATGAVG
jgi:hypothetical protein